MSILLALSVFFSTMLILVVVLGYLSGRQEIRQRLGSNAGLSSLSDLGAKTGWRNIVAKAGVYFESSSWAKRQEDSLLKAGIPMRGSEFMVVSLGVGAVGFIFLLLFSGKLLGGIAGGVVAFFIPTLVVKRKIARKQALVDEQLPEALSLMGNSLRSGYSFLQAVDLVSKETSPPLSEEFALVLKEMNLGISTEDALTNLVRRVDTEDLDLTVTAFLIQRQIGGNLAELLDNISETIRSRITMKGKINTLTAQGKLSGIVLCGLPIFMAGALSVLNSDFLGSFVNHPIGRILLGGGLLLQLVGIAWMRSIIRIDV